MRKLLIAILVLISICDTAYADCNWKTDITTVYGGPAPHYLYTKECHIKVGENVRDLIVDQNTISELGKIISLKDEEIDLSDQRVELWKNTSAKLEDRLNEVQRLESRNMWLYIGVGVLATGLVFAGVHQIH